ncbi:MAG TPA: hypothetical protein V6D17_05870 [Candidatus Obscuribacterales bacterium]
MRFTLSWLFPPFNDAPAKAFDYKPNQTSDPTCEKKIQPEIKRLLPGCLRIRHSWSVHCYHESIPAANHEKRQEESHQWAYPMSAGVLAGIMFTAGHYW